MAVTETGGALSTMQASDIAKSEVVLDMPRLSSFPLCIKLRFASCVLCLVSCDLMTAHDPTSQRHGSEWS